MVLVADNVAAANDFAQRKETQNLNGSNADLDGSLDLILLERLNGLARVQESLLGLGLEEISNLLELGLGRGRKTLLDVHLLGQFADNLGPEDGAVDKTSDLGDDAGGGGGGLASGRRVVSDSSAGGQRLGGSKDGLWSEHCWTRVCVGGLVGWKK